MLNAFNIHLDHRFRFQIPITRLSSKLNVAKIAEIDLIILFGLDFERIRSRGKLKDIPQISSCIWRIYFLFSH